MTVRYQGLPPLYEGALILSCRKPGAPSLEAAADVGNVPGLAGSAAPA